MKHLFIWAFLGFFLWAGVATAEVRDLGSLLDMKNRGSSQKSAYTGAPFVYIDADVDALQPKEFKPLPYLPTYTFDIKTPFGHKSEASFVPHTTDFTSKIQVLSTGDVVVDETIQFVNTKQDYVFNRVIGKNPNTKFSFIKATLDNRPIVLTTEEANGSWNLKDTQVLPAGIHTYTFSYLIKNAIQDNGQIANLRLSLTGEYWELPIERFSAVVLFPKKSVKSKTAVFKTDVTFGANELKIPQTTQIYDDENGNIFMTITRPLPAFADIKINVDFDKNILMPISVWDQILSNVSGALFFACGSILILYALISTLFLKLSKPSIYAIKELSAYSFLTLRRVAEYRLSKNFTYNLNSFYIYSKKRKIIFKGWMHILRKKQLSKIAKTLASVFIWINIMYKYVLTEGLMIMLTIWQADKMNAPLATFEIISLMGIAVLTLVWIYYKAEKPYIKREMAQFLDNSYSTDIGFGLSKTSVQALLVRFYPYMLAFNKGDDWVNYLKQYNLDLKELTFLDEKEISL